MADEQIDNLSALDANIKEKGANSYYFAHSLKINGPAWDGKEEPRLLRVEESPANSNKLTIVTFDSYSWLDDGKHIKIYVDNEGSDVVEEANVSIVSGFILLYDRFLPLFLYLYLQTNTTNSLKFTVNIGANKAKQLTLDNLYAEIEDATYKMKPNRFIITLKKASEETWSKLKK